MMTEILNREDTQSVLFMGLMSPENGSQGTQAAQGGAERAEAPLEII